MRVLWTLVLLGSLQSGASQRPALCGPPVVYEDKRLDEKYAEFTEFKNGEKVAYKCVKGYTPSEGSRISFCRNGQWEPLKLVCKKKQCGSAGEIENGRFNYNGNLFGDRAYAECNEGFVLQGERVRECLDDGSWNGTVPTCVESPSSSAPLANTPPHLPCLLPSLSRSRKRMCRHPTSKNGTFNQTKNLYDPGESLSFSCDVGHKPAGNFSITCQSNGMFAPDLPKCEIIKCPNLNITNGAVNKSSVILNSTLKITCKDGFQLKGPQLITCALNGSWAPSIPTCVQEVRCPVPDVPDSKMVTGGVKDYSVGERVTIICEETFRLIGPSQVTCGSDGQWKDVPECRSITGNCGRLPYHPNAMANTEYGGPFKPGTSVRYKCSVGYRWAGGSASIRCENGRWTPLEIICERKLCGNAGEIQNGRYNYSGVKFGDTATAECDEGHFLVGQAVRNCKAEGWDGRAPVCEVVKCLSPPEVDGAVMTGPDGPVQYRQVVTYRCLTGSLVGAADIYCTKDGNWSAPPPTCKDNSCPEPKIRFGSIIYGARAQYKPRDTVMFTCNPGWRLRGSGVVTCGQNGKWNPSLPTCYRFQPRRTG